MSEQTSAAREIAAGYATSGGAVELGSVVIDNTPNPDALVQIPLAMMNRHGLIAGATGTGKTKTLQAIAEQLSAAGVPVVMADVKGDLSGLAREGTPNDKITARAAQTGDDWQPTAFPVQFFSLGTSGAGVPIRATIGGFGPILLAKVLALNETQESTLGLIFHWADDKGLPLLDTKDLRAVITHLTSPEGKADLQGIGGVSAATAGVILRALSNVEAQGGHEFFGEPELSVADLMRSSNGKGVISLLELGNLQDKPTLFSTFLMWLLAELFEELPEAGDLDAPRLVFFFDEAHLLFDGASKAFLERIEQTVKLIRSRGVGVFFCTQLPTDLPNAVLSQLGARVQHALRAFTPDDQKALTRTVKTYPTTSHYALDKVLTSLGIGEAIVTVLGETGAPTPVALTRLRSPRSLMAAVGDDTIRAAATSSELHGKYAQTIDRESAYEMMATRAAARATSQGEGAAATPEAPAAKRDKHEPTVVEQILGNTAVRSFLRSAAGAAGREITRGLFGTRRRR